MKCLVLLIGDFLRRWTFQLIFSVFVLFNVENAFSEEEILMETITVRGKNTHLQNDGVENLEDVESCTKKTSSSSFRINGARASDTLIFVDGIRLDDAPSADGSFNVDLLNNKKLKHEECWNDTTFEIEDNLPEKNETIISHSFASRNTLENAAKISRILNRMRFYTSWNVLSSDGYKVMDCSSKNFDSKKKITGDTKIEINPNDSLNVSVLSKTGFLKNTYYDLFGNYESGELSSKFLLNKVTVKKTYSADTNFSFGYANILQSISDYSSRFSCNKSISNLFVGTFAHQFNEKFFNEFNFQLKKTDFNRFVNNSYVVGVKNYIQPHDDFRFQIDADIFIDKNSHFLDVYTVLKRNLGKSDFSIFYSHFHKRPSLFQLYDKTFGNQALKPEKVDSIKIKGGKHIGEAYFSQAISYKIIKDLISVDKTSFRSINNGDNKEIVAIENLVSATISPLDSILKIKYTYITNPFIQYPKHKLSISLCVNDIFIIESKTIACVKDYDFIKKKNVVLGSATVFNVKFLKKISKNSELRFYVNNVFNKKYQLACGYNQEPISLGMEIKYKL